MGRILAPGQVPRHGARTNGWNSQPDAGRLLAALRRQAPDTQCKAPCLGARTRTTGSGQPPPSALPVDDGPAQADLAIVEDDGLAGGDGPLRLCKAHLDA